MNKIKKQSPKEQNVTGGAHSSRVQRAQAVLRHWLQVQARPQRNSGPAEASAGTGYRESGHIKDYYKTTRL